MWVQVPPFPPFRKTVLEKGLFLYKYVNYFQGTVDDSARNLSYTVFTAYNLFHLIVLTENVNEGKSDTAFYGGILHAGPPS